MATILMPAHRTATMAQIGLLAACLSARGPGITGLTGTGDFMADPATMAVVGTDAAGAGIGIMTDGAIMIMMAGVVESGTVTVGSMNTTTGTGTDSGFATEDQERLATFAGRLLF